ncbi:MAG: thioredoxin-disulfide reductase [Dehalococcoidia bacterium]
MPRDCELLIVGGGAAGLSAGIYAARARLDVLLIERMGAGGQLINVDRVENYPGFPNGIAGYELGPLLAQQAMDGGLSVEYGDVTSIQASPEGGYIAAADGEAVRAKTIILACGSTLSRLDVPGEAEFEGNGVSYCATCDAEFFRDQPVVVIGGGDSALDEALYLTNVAASVTIVHRRDAFRAERIGQERIRNRPNCRVVWNTTVTRIVGDETVRTVELRNTLDGTTSKLDASGVFIYVGLHPNSAYLQGIVDLDAGGHVLTDPRLATSAPGIFAAGDLRQHSARQVAAAVGDGVTAAISAERFLRGELAR